MRPCSLQCGDLDSDSFILGKAWREVRYGEMLVCPLLPSAAVRNGSCWWIVEARVYVYCS